MKMVGPIDPALSIASAATAFKRIKWKWRYYDVKDFQKSITTNQRTNLQTFLITIPSDGGNELKNQTCNKRWCLLQAVILSSAYTL